MKVAEVIVKILEDEGITDAFGIPGAGINPVYKYLGESKSIKHYTMRHEEAAVHAADGYFRASGKMALAICTSGPGATNFTTGMYTASIDSIPLIAITGQAASSLLDKEPFQCVNIAEICKPVAKATWCVLKAEEIPQIMRQAFKIARKGRPGPVLIDLPLDIQMADIDYDPKNDKSLELEIPQPDLKQITKAVEMLKAAKSPVIIMGGGVVLSSATKELVELAEYMQIPVIPTYMAKGGIPADHPLNAGHMGIQVGGPLANKVFLESDVVLGVGCRFSDRHTGDLKTYIGNRKFIHIDIDAVQLDRVIKPDVGILSDAKLAINALMQEIKKTTAPQEASDRVKSLPELRETMKRKTFYDSIPIKPQRVYYEINKCFDENTMYTTGCGLTQIWSGQFQEVSVPRKYLPSGGAGTLGFDIPAAIGATAAVPGTKAVAVMGDFGFTFMVEELAVAAKNDSPIIVVIVNNAYLSLIRQNQKYAYGYEYGVRMEENHGFVDYVKVAEGLGCAAERIFKPEDISGAFKRAIESKKPYVIDIIVEEQTDCSMGGSIAAVREFE